MVFESLVVDVLNRFLGDYVVNLDSSQLKLGIWGGTGLARRGGAARLPSCRRVPSCPAGFALPPAQGRRPRRRPLSAAGPGRAACARDSSAAVPPARPLKNSRGGGQAGGLGRRCPRNSRLRQRRAAAAEQREELQNGGKRNWAKG